MLTYVRPWFSVFLFCLCMAGCGSPEWNPERDSLQQLGELLPAAVDQVEKTSDGWLCKLDGAKFRIIATKDQGEGIVSLVFSAQLGMTPAQTAQSNVDFIPFKFIPQGENTIITSSMVIAQPISDAGLRSVLLHQVQRVRALSAALIINKNGSSSLLR